MYRKSSTDKGENYNGILEYQKNCRTTAQTGP